MTTFGEHILPQVPEWLRIFEPAGEHPAAFEAWLHVTTRCVLVKLWMADGAWLAEHGYWRFDVLHPDGRRRTAWVAAMRAPAESSVLQSASAVVRELVRTIEQAR